MKKIFFSVAVAMLTLTAFAQDKVADVAKFESETINFGKIKQGVPQKGTFVVTNLGKTPLIIEQANPTCGCTISDYTKEPIAPGKTGVINATYNAAAMGHFEKHLTVKFAGINEMKSITFTGDVLAAEEYEKLKLQDAKAGTEKEAVAVPLQKATAVPAVKKAPAKTLKKAAKAN
jgi:hypothetical protein